MSVVVATNIEHTSESFTVHFNNVTGYPKKNGEFVSSPRVGCWRLRLYLAGYDAATDLVSLMLAYEGQEDEVRASLRYKIGNISNFTDSGLMLFNELNKLNGIRKLALLSNFMNEAYQYIKEDSVVIQVVVVTYGKTIEDNNYATLQPISTLPQDMSMILFNSSNSDITIKVGNELIPAHKLILCMRSEVFAAMFKCDMIEASTNVIEISDFEADVVKELLRYMYTDACNLSVVNVEQLLSMAHLYHIIGLIALCGHHLVSIINADNVLRLAMLAMKLSLPTLKNATFRFIAKNSKVIMEQNSFFESIDVALRN